MTKEMGGDFDTSKKQLPPPREFNVQEKKVGFFAKMKNKVTASVPKELSVPKCAELVRSDLIDLGPERCATVPIHSDTCAETLKAGASR